MSERDPYARLRDSDERLRWAASEKRGSFPVTFLRDAIFLEDDDPRPQSRVADLGVGYFWDMVGGLAEDVGALAFTPDGQLLVTGGSDGRAKVWDAQSGRELWCPAPLSSSILAVEIDAEGRQLACGSSSGDVMLARLDRPGPPFIHRERDDCVRSLAFSPDGKRLAVGLRSQKARLYSVDPRSGRLESPIDLGGHRGLVEAVAWRPDGSQLVALDDRGFLRVWQAPWEKPVVDGRLDADGLDGARLSPDGKLLATWSSFGAFYRLYDAVTWDKLDGVALRDYVVNGLAWHPSGKKLIVNVAPFGLIVFGHPYERLERIPTRSRVTAVEWSPVGERLAVGLSVEEEVRDEVAGVVGGGFTVARAPQPPKEPGLYGPGGVVLVDPKLEERSLGLAKGPSPIGAMSWSPDGVHLALGLWQTRRPRGRGVLVVEVDAPRCQIDFDVKEIVGCLEWSPGGGFLAGTFDGQVAVWDVKARKEVARLTSREIPEARRIAWLPAGDRLLVVGADDRLRIVDPVGRRIDVTSGAGGGGAITVVRVSRDGRRVASLSRGGRALLVWDADDLAEPRRRIALGSGRGDPWALAMCPTGAWLATSEQHEPAICLWDAATGESLGRLVGHETWALALEPSPDGARLASVSDDGSLRLWSIAGRVEERCLRLTSSYPRSLAWSPDGARLACGAHEVALVRP